MRFLVLWLAAFVLASTSHAHDLKIEVESQNASAFRLFYVDGTPFAFEAYEVFPEGSEIPVQVGRTDALGQIAFLPQETGNFRVRAFSEDGHGVDRIVYLEEKVSDKRGVRSFQLSWVWQLLIGIGVILALFGSLRLLMKRKPVVK